MKIGFIGMGNMAKAIASGFIASRKIQKEKFETLFQLIREANEILSSQK